MKSSNFGLQLSLCTYCQVTMMNDDVITYVLDSHLPNPAGEKRKILREFDESDIKVGELPYRVSATIVTVIRVMLT